MNISMHGMGQEPQFKNFQRDAKLGIHTKLAGGVVSPPLFWHHPKGKTAPFQFLCRWSGGDSKQEQHIPEWV